MSIDRNLTVGWLCELRSDLDYYDVCEDVVEHSGHDIWRDFIIGTDPMLGEENHICVFNHEGYALDYDEHDSFTITENEFKVFPLPPQANIFAGIVKELYGDDAIKFYFGIRQWFS